MGEYATRDKQSMPGFAPFAQPALERRRGIDANRRGEPDYPLALFWGAYASAIALGLTALLG